LFIIALAVLSKPTGILLGLFISVYLFCRARRSGSAFFLAWGRRQAWAYIFFTISTALEMRLPAQVPTLPLRPGVYSWRVALYDAGVRIDDWECVPNMHVVTIPITHYRDESADFLNIPSTLEIVPAQLSQ
jgi:hypothetical protein